MATLDSIAEGQVPSDAAAAKRFMSKLMNTSVAWMMMSLCDFSVFFVFSHRCFFVFSHKMIPSSCVCVCVVSFFTLSTVDTID